MAAEVAALAAGVPTDERPVQADSGVEETVDPAAGAEVAHDVEIVDHAAKPAGAKVHSSTELMEQILGTAQDAPICLTCGTKMSPAGSCHVCEGCGSTSGCS